MAAITWRNVEAPSIGEASRAMYLGGMGINNGFDKLGEVLKQREATDTANWNQQKVNNTNGLFNKLLGYSTPEEYQAAMASGELQQEMAGMGAQVDQTALRQAMDKRLPELQQRAVQQQQYKDQQLDVQSRPIVDQLSTMALSEDKDLRASAKAALGVYAGQGMLNKPADLATKIDAADNTFAVRDRAAKQFGFEEAKAKRDTEMFPLDIAAKQADNGFRIAQKSESEARTALYLAQAEEAKKEKAGNSTKLASAASAAALEEYKKSNVYGEGDFNTSEGQKEFSTWFDKYATEAHGVDKKDISDILYNLDILRKQSTVPLPISEIKLAIQGATDNPLALGWSRMGDDVRNTLATKLADNSKHYRDSYDGLQQAIRNQVTPGLLSQASKAEASTNPTAPQLPKPTSTAISNPAVDLLLKRAALANQTGDSEEEDTRVNPNLNNPVWMADRRREAIAKNEKLPEELKRKLNIK